MLSKGIDTTIRELVAELPKGTGGGNTSGVDFEKLVASLATQISSAIITAVSAQAGTSNSAAAPASAAAGAAAEPTAAAGIPASQRLNSLQLSLLRDRTSPMLEQLSSSLAGGDPLYNQRESQLRERLDLNALENRLQEKARHYEVSYDRSDLDGILRNAGYDATHLGSSERYMAAIEKYLGEAEKNYRRRSDNDPGQLA